MVISKLLFLLQSLLFLSFDLCLVFLFDDFVLWLLAPFLDIGFDRNLEKIIPFTIQIRQSPLRTKQNYCPLRICLICIVNTIRIQLLKSKSIILSTHFNKIEFMFLPIRSRRSNKHRWNLHHLLPHPQPIPTKHALNLIRKKAISFSNYSIYYWLGFEEKK